MERKEDRNFDAEIDLGSIAAETKGSPLVGEPDEIQLAKPGIGISED